MRALFARLQTDTSKIVSTLSGDVHFGVIIVFIAYSTVLVYFHDL